MVVRNAGSAQVGLPLRGVKMHPTFGEDHLDPRPGRAGLLPGFLGNLLALVQDHPNLSLSPFGLHFSNSDHPADPGSTALERAVTS